MIAQLQHLVISAFGSMKIIIEPNGSFKFGWCSIQDCYLAAKQINIHV